MRTVPLLMHAFSPISILPASLGARFQLLTFALKFLARTKTNSGSRLTENLLREYIYSAALSWFLEAPSYAAVLLLSHSPSRLISL